MTIGVRKSLSLLMMSSAILFAAPAVAAGGQGESVTFQVSAGTLDNALTQIASQSGRQILFDPALVRGRTVAGIRGAMTPEAAVAQLLDGTGLVLRIDDNGRWLVVRGGTTAAAQADGNVLDTVRVTTGEEQLAHVGANGSSDILATEGTKSYTTTAQGITSKQPLTLKETPQAVSVITRQQLDDRTINSLDSALVALPGVTVSASQAVGLATAIYSRGFEITNVQIDGGSPISIGATTNFSSSRSIVDDLSAYDSVEVERGAGGQFTGVGAPGGVLSLIRKRPLDHAALDVTLQAGSWDRLREVIDASSPTMLNGLVRARVVLTGERNDEFYDIATRRFWQAYANVEIDPSPTTTINLGVKMTRNRSTPFNGLPTDAAGGLIDFSRATCYCTDWGQAVVKGREYFAQATQKIGTDWSVHLNGSVDLQNTNAHYFNYVADSGGVDVKDEFSAFANIYNAKRKSNQYLVDGYVAGKTNAFGMGVDLTLGANFQNVKQEVDEYENYYYYSNSVADLLPFDPANFPDQPASVFEPGIQTTPVNMQKQYGVYGTLRLSPVDWVHFTIGERFTHYAFAAVTQLNFGGTLVRSNRNAKFNTWSPPNVGLVVDINKDISAFASYASIFDRNNLYNKQGDLVDPTTGLNAEIGLKSALNDGQINLAGSLFYIRQINLPQLDVTSQYSGDPTNGSSCCYITDGSKYTSKGVDLHVQGAVTPRLNVDLSYVYTDFKYIAGSTGQLYSQQLTQPDHLVKLWGAWKPPVADDHLSLGAGIHAETDISASRTLNVFVPGQGFRERTYVTQRGGYVTADAMVKYELSAKIGLQLNLTNLFDRTYYQTVRTGYGNYYGTPRSFLLTLHGAL